MSFFRCDALWWRMTLHEHSEPGEKLEKGRCQILEDFVSSMNSNRSGYVSPCDIA